MDENGYVRETEALTHYVEVALKSIQATKINETPVIYTEPNIQSNAVRAKLAQISFEKVGINAMFVAKSAVLTSYSQGKSTALVVDSGTNKT